MTDKDRFLADRERNFAAALHDFPEASDLLVGARRVGPIRVVPDWYGYFRQAAGPGWVLTGDAGHFKDPTPGQGMSDALHHSRRLADLIAAHIGSRRDLDKALGEFWRWRDDDCYEMYWFAADMGAAGPTTPLIGQVMRGIAADQQASADLLAVLNRDLRPSALFSPARVGKAFVRQAVIAPNRLPGLTREFVAAARAETRRARQRRAVTRAQPPLSAISAPSGTARESRVSSHP